MKSNPDLEQLRQSLLDAANQIERGEYQDCDEAFDEIEIELFGKRLANDCRGEPS